MFYNIIVHFVYVAPSMMVYHQSHRRMMNLTMRIGGMQGGSPGMGGVQSAHIYAAVPIDALQERPSWDRFTPRGRGLLASQYQGAPPTTSRGTTSDSNGAI